MRLTIAYSKKRKRNLVLVDKDACQRETLTKWPIRLPLNHNNIDRDFYCCEYPIYSWEILLHIVLYTRGGKNLLVSPETIKIFKKACFKY